MLRTWPGERPNARPLASVGTMLGRPLRVMTWSSRLGPSRLSRAAEMALRRHDDSLGNVSC